MRKLMLISSKNNLIMSQPNDLVSGFMEMFSRVTQTPPHAETSPAHVIGQFLNQVLAARPEVSEKTEETQTGVPVPTVIKLPTCCKDLTTTVDMPGVPPEDITVTVSDTDAQVSAKGRETFTWKFPRGVDVSTLTAVYKYGQVTLSIQGKRRTVVPLNMVTAPSLPSITSCSGNCCPVPTVD